MFRTQFICLSFLLAFTQASSAEPAPSKNNGDVATSNATDLDPSCDDSEPAPTANAQPPSQNPPTIAPRYAKEAEAQENLRSGNKARAESRWSEALKYYGRAADLGLPQAQCNLGVMYMTGRGVSKDEAEAVRWFHKAADQGSSTGQLHLGEMYSNGHGVTKDEAEAMRWYRKAADQGDAQAQGKLRYLYMTGRGISKDQVEAMR